MGLFSKLRRKEELEPGTIYAPVIGTAIPLTDCAEQRFKRHASFKSEAKVDNLPCARRSLFRL